MKDLCPFNLRIGVAVLVAALLVPAVAQAAFTGKDGALAYQVQLKNRSWEVVISTNKGKKAKNISKTPVFSEFNPAISPNGKLVAYESDREGGLSKIYMTTLNKKERKLSKKKSRTKKVTSRKGNDTGFAFCKNESWGVFTKSVGTKKGDLYSVNVKTGKEYRLTKTGVSESSATCSPNGKTLYYVKERSGASLAANDGVTSITFDILSQRLKGFKKLKGKPKILTEGGSPDISGDGTMLVYTASDENLMTQIYALDLKDLARGPIQLTAAGFMDGIISRPKFTPSFDPDDARALTRTGAQAGPSGFDVIFTVLPFFTGSDPNKRPPNYIAGLMGLTPGSAWKKIVDGQHAVMGPAD